MELESVISIVGLLLGGGSIGSVIGLRYAKKRALADAKQAEAEAKKAEAEAMKEEQGYYQQLIDDLAKDREDRKAQNDDLRNERDYYKRERDELREKLDKLTRSVMEWKEISEDERMSMKKDIARLGMQLDFLRPLICGRENCALRVKVSMPEDIMAKTKRTKKKEAAGEWDGAATVSQQSQQKPKDIEPIDMKDM